MPSFTCAASELSVSSRAAASSYATICAPYLFICVVSMPAGVSSGFSPSYEVCAWYMAAPSLSARYTAFVSSVKSITVVPVASPSSLIASG